MALPPNALPSDDYTAYPQKISRDNLAQAVEMETDRMVNLNITDEVFQPERDVVLEERNMRVDSRPISAFFELFNKEQYKTKNYIFKIIRKGYERQSFQYKEGFNKALDKVNSNAIKYSLHLFDGRIYKESSYTDKSRYVADCVYSLSNIDCTWARRIENQTKCISARLNSGICIFSTCNSTNFDPGAAHNNSFSLLKHPMIPEAQSCP